SYLSMLRPPTPPTTPGPNFFRSPPLLEPGPRVQRKPLNIYVFLLYYTPSTPRAAPVLLLWSPYSTPPVGSLRPASPGKSCFPRYPGAWPRSEAGYPAGSAPATVERTGSLASPYLPSGYHPLRPSPAYPGRP